MHNYSQVLALLGRYPLLLAGIVVVSILGAAVEGLGVGLVLPLLNEPQNQEQLFHNIPLLSSFERFLKALTLVNLVRFVAIALVIIVLIQSVMRYVDRLLVLQLRINVERMLKQEAFRQLHSVSLQFIHHQRFGDLITTIGRHTQEVSMIVSELAGAISNLSLLAIYGLLMMMISWELTIVAAGLLLLLVVISPKGTAKRLHKAGERRRTYVRKLQRTVLDSLLVMKLTKLHSQEKQSVKCFDKTLKSYLHHYYTSEKLIHQSSPLYSVRVVLGLSVLLIIGTLLLPSQVENWLGQVGIFVIIVFRLMGPAAQLSRSRSQITAYFPALNTVMDFLAKEGKPYLKDGEVNCETIRHAITLEDVSFQYNADEDQVLKNVSFEIPQGSFTAVVGASGAGKSTIVGLVARLYDCTSGRICVDNIDLRDLTLASWHSITAVVSQDALLINDTVLANLKIARQAATEAEVHQAAQLAQIHDFIESLPEGYETQIGDRGVRLSGGQQQRLAIARGLLADPQLLILDEATSDLDSKTEKAIQMAINRYSQGRTMLVIAHRLSTIRQAHNIVVLDEGRVVEQGNHEELMQRSSFYWKLVQAQNWGDVAASSDGI